MCFALCYSFLEFRRRPARASSRLRLSFFNAFWTGDAGAGRLYFNFVHRTRRSCRGR